MPRARVIVSLVVACVLTGAAAVAAGVLQPRPEPADRGARDALTSARAPGRAVVVFRSLAAGNSGAIGVAPVAGASRATTWSRLRCARVHYSGATGLCVARSRSTAGYRALIFGADLRVRHEVELAGTPSRTRVSRDGRVGAVTMFVTGHAYAPAGTFSAETTLLDLRHGTEIAELEDFTVSRRGRVMTAEDMNFWGVTFAPGGDLFYATMASGGRTYLVRGSIHDRTLRTLHENVECPSLSPDGTRIAYKRRVGSGEDPWRLTVLNLATMRETRLSETHGFDDQAEWLDDDRILYGLAGEIRIVPADGTGIPHRFRAHAASPAVVRS